MKGVGCMKSTYNMGMQVPYCVYTKIQKKRNLWKIKIRDRDDIERHLNLKYKYGNKTFWCTGYYVKIVQDNKTAVYRYVEKQLKEDRMTDQITIKEYRDPFKGSKQQRCKRHGIKPSNKTSLTIACNKALQAYIKNHEQNSEVVK